MHCSITYDSIQQVKQEIDLVMASVRESAIQLLPLYGKKNVSGKPFHDIELRRLCDDSKKTWSEWVSAGRPANGGLYSKKNSLKRAVRQRINTLKAIEERKIIQQ